MSGLFDHWSSSPKPGFSVWGLGWGWGGRRRFRFGGELVGCEVDLFCTDVGTAFNGGGGEGGGDVC